MGDNRARANERPTQEQIDRFSSECSNGELSESIVDYRVTDWINEAEVRGAERAYEEAANVVDRQRCEDPCLHPECEALMIAADNIRGLPTGEDRG